MHLNKAHISDTFIQYIEMGIVSDLRCATSYLFSLLRSSDTIKSQSLGAQGIRFVFFLIFPVVCQSKAQARDTRSPSAAPGGAMHLSAHLLGTERQSFL